jgi:predicted nucleic acid-binding protein
LLISRLSVVEMQSVLAGKQRAGLVTSEDAEALRKRFVADIGTQAIEVVSLADLHFTAAETVIRRYVTKHRLRTRDALQLAVALSVTHNITLDYFVSADRTLCTTAAREGLNAINPED